MKNRNFLLPVQLPAESKKHQLWCKRWGGDIRGAKPGCNSNSSGLDQLKPSWNRTSGWARQRLLFKLFVLMEFFLSGSNLGVVLKGASSSAEKGWAASLCNQWPFPQTRLCTGFCGNGLGGFMKPTGSFCVLVAGQALMSSTLC